MITYYTNSCIKLMTDWENTQEYDVMFEDIYPELTDRFWSAVDKKNERSLRCIWNLITKMVDDQKEQQSNQEEAC